MVQENGHGKEVLTGVLREVLIMDLNPNAREFRPRERNKLTVVSINANSLYSPLQRGKLENAIEKIDPHLIFVCETKTEKNGPVLLLTGYVQIARCDRSKGGGGVACFAKPSLKVHHEMEFFISEDIQMVSVSFKDIRFVCTYRAPGSGLVSQGSSTLAIAKLKELMKGHSKFVLMGDLNLKGLGTEWRPRTRQGTQSRTNDDLWAEFAHEAGLDQLVKSITRKPDSTIDVVLASNTACVDDVEADFSSFYEFDHAGIVFTVETEPEIRVEERIKFRESEGGWEKFLASLANVNLGLYMHAYNCTAEDKINLIAFRYWMPMGPVWKNMCLDLNQEKVASGCPEN